MKNRCTCFALFCGFLLVDAPEPAGGAEPAGPVFEVGAARIDITPDYPVRLSGYSSRRENAHEAAQPIWAKALAIQGPEEGQRLVLLTVENCGVPQSLTDAVCRELAAEGLAREQIVVSSSHSHTAPWLIGFAPFLAREPVPPDHQQARQRYSRELVPQLVRAVREALANRRPARLFLGEGTVAFAANRRVLRNGSWTGFGVQPDGPVDHRLPVLVARDERGRPIAIWANYACHCTTLGGSFNQISGDWAGLAQERIEADFPEAVALISIGFGADANPEPRGSLELARRHGEALAAEVRRVIEGPLRPLREPPQARRAELDLPLAEVPDRAAWEQEASSANGSAAQRARHFLDRLQRGEPLPATVPYSVTCWTFGRELAMVFLPGEVVVDYALALDRRLDAQRLWLTAYANDVPCYIASKRILREGGYEADGSMIYYGQPTRLAEASEDRILETVVRLLPEFRR